MKITQMSNKYFKYKGYIGSAEVCLESECLIGQIMFIEDLNVYEAETFGELKQEFEDTVDEYLAICEEVGKEPNKTFHEIKMSC